MLLLSLSIGDLGLSFIQHLINLTCSVETTSIQSDLTLDWALSTAAISRYLDYLRSRAAVTCLDRSLGNHLLGRVFVTFGRCTRPKWLISTSKPLDDLVPTCYDTSIPLSIYQIVPPERSFGHHLPSIFVKLACGIPSIIFRRHATYFPIQTSGKTTTPHPIRAPYHLRLAMNGIEEKMSDLKTHLRSLLILRVLHRFHIPTYWCCVGSLPFQVSTLLPLSSVLVIKNLFWFRPVFGRCRGDIEDGGRINLAFLKLYVGKVSQPNTMSVCTPLFAVTAHWTSDLNIFVVKLAGYLCRGGRSPTGRGSHILLVTGMWPSLCCCLIPPLVAHANGGTKAVRAGGGNTHQTQSEGNVYMLPFFWPGEKKEQDISPLKGEKHSGQIGLPCEVAAAWQVNDQKNTLLAINFCSLGLPHSSSPYFHWIIHRNFKKKKGWEATLNLHSGCHPLHYYTSALRVTVLGVFKISFGGKKNIYIKSELEKKNRSFGKKIIKNKDIIAEHSERMNIKK
ncbi:putative signal peptide protein [Puccinia sorghi]|uniref:Putative signal peptide protein n=1 Tax=Puccinia sorghi TaxID=27349 RepID=A0A0L6VS23_9BASI|nr:putative signal peptide protein [Puccinia sorghi]